MIKKTHTPLFVFLWILLFQIAIPSTAQPYASHSKLATGSWYKVAIERCGIHRISISDIPSLNGVSCDKIALFGSTGNVLSIDNNDVRPDDLPPVAIQLVDLNGNQRFDGDDYLLFCAEGPEVWRHDYSLGRFVYQINPYSNYNYYFLTSTFSGNATQSETLRITTSPITTATQGDLTEYTSVAVLNQEKTNPNNGGQTWLGDRYTPTNTQYRYSLSLPSPQAGSNLLTRYGFASNSNAPSSFRVSIGSENRSLTFNKGNHYRTFNEAFTQPSSSSIEVVCTYAPNENSATGYIDFIELNGISSLSYTSGQLFIRNTQRIATGNSCRFIVDGTASSLQAWDITHACQPTFLPLNNTNHGCSFVAPTEEIGTYLLFTPTDAFIPASIEIINNQDLHGSDPVDYVIVTHRDFLNQAEQIADLHRLHDGMQVLVTTQDAVFNEFSSGKKDPIAIRQLLRCLKAKGLATSEAVPRYLLLFGKGTFDNRDLLNTGFPTVVTYQNPVTYDFYDGATPTEDIFGFLGMEQQASAIQNLEVSIGRLPAKNQAEADLLVDKITGYIECRDLQNEDIRGDWRNYVCLLSDDADPSSSGDTNFVTSSEATARLIKQQYPHFNIDRIYADAFVQQSGADGSYYPDVNNALRQRINYGCLLLNYIGHGSSQYIGTERYMQLSDIEKYSNTDRLAFFVTSTCTFGRYDHASEISGAEAFILAPAAGVGVISAARPITHIQRFNTDICISALNPDNTIGDALRFAKNRTSASRTIILLGDPALHLSIPKNKAMVTQINDAPVCDTVADSLLVLSKVTVDGVIQNASGDIRSDFNGEIFPIVFDREVKCHTLANDNDSTEVSFFQQKNILYKGREKVTNGRFTFSFIIPKDVSYRYDYAKISLFAKSEFMMATGHYSNLMFGGFNDTITIDEIHPTVQLYINDTSFRNGALTNETPTLFARLSDSIGINAAGSGLGHDITAIIDGNPFSTITLNDFFEPDILDSRNGQICYTLGKLDDGPHTLTLKCWNIFNYSGSATIHFNVVNHKSATIANLCAAPNPATDHTTLRIEHNMAGRIASCRFDIYNMMGQPVRSFSPVLVDGSPTIAVSWDFTTEDGIPLPQGIYILRATLSSTDGSIQSETVKLVKK